MAGLVPRIIVLALGTGALGGADALRLLLGFAGQSPLVDIAICIFVIGMLAAQLLGAVLLARFVRKGRAQAGAGGGAPGASATDCFAKITLMVSVGVAFVVAACLVVVSGGLRPFHLEPDFSDKSPIIAVLAVGVAGFLACIMPLPLLRDFGEAGNAGGRSPATARATGRVALTTQAKRFVGLLLLSVPFVAPGGLDALRLIPGVTNTFVGVGVGAATVAGAVLLFRFYRRTPNAAGAGGVAAPAPVTGFDEM